MNVVVVSPCTRTMSTWRRQKSSSRELASRDVRLLSDWPSRIRFRSSSGVILKTSRTWSSMPRCCAVTTTSGSNASGRDRSSQMSGANLIASGLVPKTVAIVRRCFIVTHTSPGVEARGPSPACCVRPAGVAEM